MDLKGTPIITNHIIICIVHKLRILKYSPIAEIVVSKLSNRSTISASNLMAIFGYYVNYIPSSCACVTWVAVLKTPTAWLFEVPIWLWFPDELRRGHQQSAESEK